MLKKIKKHDIVVCNHAKKICEGIFGEDKECTHCKPHKKNDGCSSEMCVMKSMHIAGIECVPCVVMVETKRGKK